MIENETVPGLAGFAGPVRGIACVLALTAALASGPSSSRAAEPFPHEYLARASRCRTALEDTASDGARCLFGRALDLVLEKGMGLADRYGKRAFGPRFRMVGNLSHGPASNGAGLEGAVDLVLPFAHAGLPPARPTGPASFLQQGVSRVSESSAPLRNDLRHGLVHRFRLSRTPDADILGVSVFHLWNLEYGHEVMAPGIDYAGKWGAGSFRYFIPATGWRPGRLQYEERALEGFEVGARFDLTTTLRLNAAGYRWKTAGVSEVRSAGSRLSLDWRPHPWLLLGAGYDGIGGSRDAATFRIGFHAPLGAPSERPQWQGLGAAPDHSPPASADLWRPADDVGSIRVATRRSSAASAQDPAVRFLQDTVDSGARVQLEVRLPSAAPRDVRVVVRLVPGNGANPAAAGEDFIDQPVEATIREGTNRVRVEIPLLRNHRMRESRSLGATVSVAS